MDTVTKLTPDRFAQGLTVQEFVLGMSKNREIFRENYSSFTVRPEDVEFFTGHSKVSHVLALVEDWCGDVLRYLPALARLAEAIPGWQVRILYRDENLDLADNWKKQGQFRAIPIIVFFDDQWNERACFIEKPSNVYAAETEGRQAFVDQHPDLPDASLPSDKMSATTLDLYIPFIREFRAGSRNRWQQMFVDEIKGKLGSDVT